VLARAVSLNENAPLTLLQSLKRFPVAGANHPARSDFLGECA